MEAKHLLWTAIIIILLIAAGAIYYSMTLSSKPSPYQSTPTTPPATTTTPSAVDTTELDKAAKDNDKDLSAVEGSVTDFTAVDPAQEDISL